jgi:hypothetical protein
MQASIEPARAMALDECVDFLVDLQREIARADGKVRVRHSTKGKRRPRVAWIGPLTPGPDVRIVPLGNVFGIELRTIATTQDIRLFRKRLLEVRASDAIFLWESRCANLDGIARSAFSATPTEACQEWEWEDMLLSLRLWLQQKADEFIPTDGIGMLAQELIQKKLGDAKVLCVSPQNRPDLKTALQRGGFPVATIEEMFHEEKIEFGENSNLMQTLEGKADRYSYLLYSWEGLRHTSSAVEQRFGKNLFKGRTARNVVEQFKQHVLT